MREQVYEAKSTRRSFSPACKHSLCVRGKRHVFLLFVRTDMHALWTDALRGAAAGGDGTERAPTLRWNGKFYTCAAWLLRCGRIAKLGTLGANSPQLW